MDILGYVTYGPFHISKTYYVSFALWLFGYLKYRIVYFKEKNGLSFDKWRNTKTKMGTELVLNAIVGIKYS